MNFSAGPACRLASPVLAVGITHTSRLREPPSGRVTRTPTPEAVGSVRVTRVPLPVFLDKHPEGGLLGPVVVLCLASRGPNMLVGVFKWLAPPAVPGLQRLPNA